MRLRRGVIIRKQSWSIVWPVTDDDFLARLHALPAQEAAALVHPCCASRTWAAGVAAGRPYPDVAGLVADGSAAVLGLAWDDVLEALSAHPRIGDRPEGSGTEATWSRGEQGSMTEAGDDVRERLAVGNAAYEERFGYVYLVCATGLSPAELLERLVGRLGNTPEDEHDVVRRELSAITALRLGKLVNA